MSINLGWGNSVCVREAFLDNYLGISIQFHKADLLKFDYPEHTGDPAVIQLTREVIKRQIGKEYKHVFLVNGATGGCVISLRAYAMQGKINCVTRNAPHYVRYPKMIESSGLAHIDERFWQHDAVALIDIPSNPLGKFDSIAAAKVPVILDGVYLNRVYTSGIFPVIDHEIFVGSYSKLLGINGIRLGWIATNDDKLAKRISELVTSEYCGLSTASQEILKSVLFDFNWDGFESSARVKLDNNRESWQVLERFFDGTPVEPVGMFYYAPMDAKAQEIFNKAGISWVKGSAMGTDDGFARFNLGQSNVLIDEAVKAVLKADKIK